MRSQDLSFVDDRFVVTNSGGVIDIQTKEVIFDEKRINDAKNGVLLGIEDGKVVYRWPSAYFAFDLKTRKVEKLAQAGHWALPGEKSPDKTLSVTNDWDYDIHLHRLDGTSKVLSKDHEINYSPLSSTRGPGVPLLWLDKERILTQKKNGHLVILDFQGNAETVVEIKDAPEVISSPGLEMDRRNRIIYQCGHVYLIDLKGKTASRLDRYALGNGFEASVEADATKRYTVYHDGKPIGSRLEWVNPYTSRTAPGTIALETGGGIRDGIAVWNAKIGDWRTMKLHVESLVGWAQSGAGAKGLLAELSLTDTPHFIQVRYRNLTGSDVRVHRQALESSILALGFYDESGRQLHTVPPPTPNAKQEVVVIGEGKTHIVRTISESSVRRWPRAAIKCR